MRSKALPPARAQGHIVPFLEAAALFAALCIFARTEKVEPDDNAQTPAQA